MFWHRGYLSNSICFTFFLKILYLLIQFYLLSIIVGYLNTIFELVEGTKTLTFTYITRSYLCVQHDPIEETENSFFLLLYKNMYCMKSMQYMKYFYNQFRLKNDLFKFIKTSRRLIDMFKDNSQDIYWLVHFRGISSRNWRIVCNAL